MHREPLTFLLLSIFIQIYITILIFDHAWRTSYISSIIHFYNNLHYHSHFWSCIENLLHFF